jgi:hypothetical protein
VDTITLEPPVITEPRKGGGHRKVRTKDELGRVPRRMWVRRADGEFVAAAPTREGAKRA